MLRISASRAAQKQAFANRCLFAAAPRARWPSRRGAGRAPARGRHAAPSARRRSRAAFRLARGVDVMLTPPAEISRGLIEHMFHNVDNLFTT